MKDRNSSKFALAALVLLLSSCGEVGRYQMVVLPPAPFNGDERIWKQSCYVLDTKTGLVFERWSIQGRNVAQMTWKPTDITIQSDTLTKVDGNHSNTTIRIE